jgi:hypothetical protein
VKADRAKLKVSLKYEVGDLVALVSSCLWLPQRLRVGKARVGTAKLEFKRKLGLCERRC